MDVAKQKELVYSCLFVRVDRYNDPGDSAGDYKADGAFWD